MMRSLFAGVSGLQSHQTRMDVIGHNIANVNTSGYKKDRVTFQEMLSQMIRGATSPSRMTGGTNPLQIGLGVEVGSIDTNFNQGNMQLTGMGTDMAIDGNGFFVLRRGDRSYYTRAGNFQIDGRGYLVHPSGYLLQGWPSRSGSINTNQPVSDIRIPIGDNMPSAATTYIEYTGNINADDDIGTIHSASVMVFDELGSRHEIIINLEKTANNTWTWEASGATVGPGPYNGTLVFASDGSIDMTASTVMNITVVPTTGASTFNVSPRFDFLSQYAAETTVDARDVDGHTMGALDSFTIDSHGVIHGVYTNGLNRPIGQVCLANFNNPGGLTKDGASLFVESVNSGIARTGVPGEGDIGNVRQKWLEMSNVDLAEEFTDMIITQRGYQANSKIITTVDQMLQDLVNMKR